MHSLFTSEYRCGLRAELLESARTDPRITGAAVTGSAAVDREDRWSDIDLAFGVATQAAIPSLLADWTAMMYERHHAVHHLDMISGSWTYRVFFLPSTLQVDLAFVYESEFRGVGSTFKLIYGRANESHPSPSASVTELIGWGWLYALHARSCLARGRLWQAEYMISGMRDRALALACLRHGLSIHHGRGIDQLPDDEKRAFEPALVKELNANGLTRAFKVAVERLQCEVQHADAELHSRLAIPLQLLLK